MNLSARRRSRETWAAAGCPLGKSVRFTGASYPGQRPHPGPALCARQLGLGSGGAVLPGLSSTLLADLPWPAGFPLPLLADLTQRGWNGLRHQFVSSPAGASSATAGLARPATRRAAQARRKNIMLKIVAAARRLSLQLKIRSKAVCREPMNGSGRIVSWNNNAILNIQLIVNQI